MAYLTEIDVRCEAGTECGRRAVVELHRYNNEPAGRFCRSCGAVQLRELKRWEEQMWEQRRKEGGVDGSHAP